MLYILIGPGGVGKNTLMKAVLEQLDDLHQLATATTRPMRPDEREGREHEFVTIEQFQAMIANNELVEYQEVHEGIFYGVPRRTINRVIQERQDIISDLDVLGATVVREEFPDHITVIFVLPPTMRTIVDRLEARDATEKDIRDRVKRLPMEMLYVPVADYMIVNEEKDAAVAELLEVISGIRSGIPGLEHEIKLDLQVQLAVTSPDGLMLNTFTNEMPVRSFQRGIMPQRAVINMQKDLFGADTDDEPLYAHVDGKDPVEWQYDPGRRVFHIVYHFSIQLPETVDLPDGWLWKKKELMLAE